MSIQEILGDPDLLGELRSPFVFVAVYVIAWQGSAPIGLCEGSECDSLSGNCFTASLPLFLSLPSLLTAAQYKKEEAKP